VSKNFAMILFGIVFLIAGLGIGYMMYTYPEGLNPEWPLWLAMFAPAAFAFGGLHMIGAGLGYPRFAIAMIQIILVCFWVVFNWAAFFTHHIQCVDVVSFLGVEILRRYPSEEDCRIGVQIIVGTLDALFLLPLIPFVRRRMQRSLSEPPATR
jgi:hypothetical protein